MTGFEPGSSGIVSDRSANCATTTSLKSKVCDNGEAKRGKEVVSLSLSRCDSARMRARKYLSNVL